jgi:L-cysteine S-thiosulfotransferase
MMRSLLKIISLAFAAAALPALVSADVDTGATGPDSVAAVMKASMKDKNGVGLDRLVQSELQQACSNANDRPEADDEAVTLQRAAVASVIYPADGNYLGDWREGEKIAQNGKGMQYSDNPDAPNGGNCYACHQLDAREVAAGNVGPPLTGYGLRGRSEQVLKYTWAKIWNPNAYLVCSHMPRFGDAGILTPDQVRDVMAYLLDPESPVNR